MPRRACRRDGPVVGIRRPIRPSSIGGIVARLIRPEPSPHRPRDPEVTVERPIFDESELEAVAGELAPAILSRLGATIANEACFALGEELYGTMMATFFRGIAVSAMGVDLEALASTVEPREGGA